MNSPISNSFGGYAWLPVDGTRPAATWGTSFTPGNNTYPAYANLGVLTATYEGYGLWININAVGVSTLAKDLLITLGMDPTGGTTYTTWEIIDLSGSAATGTAGSTGAGSGGCWYYFPVRVPIGANFAVKATTNNATVGTVRVAIGTAIQPTHPELLRMGSFVTTFGNTPASSSGTAITPGTVSDGAWTQLGANLTKSYWYFEFGFCINNGNVTNNAYSVDVGLGDGTNNKPAINNAYVNLLNTEVVTKPLSGQGWVDGAIGDGVWARLQCGPNAADTGHSVIAYGVGG